MKRTITLFSFLLLSTFLLNAQTDKLFDLLIDGKASIEEIEAAIDNGADLNATYTAQEGWAYGLKPAHLAAAWGNLEQLKILEKKGANLLAKSLDEFPDWWNEQHSDCTPFHVGVYYFDGEKSEEVLEYLISKGADVNELCYGGQTPLMYALMSKYTDVNVIKYLVSKGADVKKLRHNSESNEDGVLYYCLLHENDKSEEAEYLIEQGAENEITRNSGNWDLFAMCIYYNENKIGKLLIENKLVDLDRKEWLVFSDENGNNINANNYLHFAVLSGNYEMTKILLLAGLDLHSKIENGSTALDIAKKNNDNSMLKLLETGEIPENLQNWINIKNSDEYSLVNFKINNEVIPFESETLDGTKINNDYFKGKVVFLNIWATWCGPCIGEMPRMDELVYTIDSDDFVILAVSVDKAEDEEKMLEYVEENDYDFTYAYDPESEGFYDYMYSLPCTTILDKQGRTVARIEGAINWDDEKYIKMIEAIINL